MSHWNANELKQIIDADDLHIAPFHADGQTTGTPTWIWSVHVDGELYVRAYSGQGSRWYQAAIDQRAGRIIAVDRQWDVAFEPISDVTLNARIDNAYREKYASSSYLAPMISQRVKAATVKITPSH